jgi:hypothetical protein
MLFLLPNALLDCLALDFLLADEEKYLTFIASSTEISRSMTITSAPCDRGCSHLRQRVPHL